jgi:hypothetical protein
VEKIRLNILFLGAYSYGFVCEIGTLDGHTPGCGPRNVFYNNRVKGGVT